MGGREMLASLYSLVVEHLPSKQEVTGSNPVTGFFYSGSKTHKIAQEAICYEKVDSFSEK